MAAFPPIAWVDLQCASESTPLPTITQFQTWVDTTLHYLQHDKTELTIRLVDKPESQTLNKTYRGKDKPTNVLSFPADVPDFIDEPLLGDLVICTPVTNQEAIEQNKAWAHHWAHMTIHGVLHLLGYDHINDDEAEVMEGLEVNILQTLNIDNPYR